MKPLPVMPQSIDKPPKSWWIRAFNLRAMVRESRYDKRN
jgi:hypothetical protein